MAVLKKVAAHLTNIRGISVADLLRVYDPTLDSEAEPAFMHEDATDGFMPLPDEFSFVDRVHVRDGVTTQYDDNEPPTLPNISGKDFRVLLNGRMVRHAFEASSKGGWVRFLAPGPDGSPYSNRSVTHLSRWGRVEDDEPGGAVTGIAFGKVEWLVRATALDRTPVTDWS